MLTVAGLLDRTLWVFRYRFFEYMKIALLTYGPPMLLMILLWNLGILNLDFLEGSAWSPDLFFFVLFVTVPTLISDIALQIYTSYLVRDNEVSWLVAVKKAFSRATFRYTPVRMMGAILLILVGFCAIFVNMIPFVGFILYWGVVIGSQTFTFGMAAPIIVEEEVVGLKVVRRNFHLARAQFLGAVLSSVAATLISFLVMLCVLIFFFVVSGLIIALVQGQESVMVMENFTERYIFTLLLLLVPLLFALVFAPLKSIYYSVLYYNLRSVKEGFHLENRVNIYLRELAKVKQAEADAVDQELENINATA